MNIFSCFKKTQSKKLDESKKPIPKRGISRDEETSGSNSKVAPINDLEKPTKHQGMNKTNNNQDPINDDSKSKYSINGEAKQQYKDSSD